ncbi:MAG: TonB family protein, partial [Acidobacteria bacterium]|nr:TonB family protein [Acidobacteriota bacterium]
TDQSGLYAANDLPAGRYTIRVQSPGFRTTERTGIRVRAGERIDVALMVEVGSCEYVAVPLQAPPKATGDLRQMKKPFTYVVGDAADNGTFRGIASLVYGDSRDWVQVFEANRNMILKPGPIPKGTPIMIPPRKRLVPELVHRVAPVYPPTARTERLWGDVVLDVTLREDGTVAAVSVVDGDPLLAGAASDAVQQWRYRPLVVYGTPVLKFIVVVSFEKNGRVR